jgi:hypothetical protein
VGEWDCHKFMMLVIHKYITYHHLTPHRLNNFDQHGLILLEPGLFPAWMKKGDMLINTLMWQ